MDFLEALKRIKEGEVVTRKLWDDPTIYCGMNDGYLSIYQKGAWNAWLVVEADIYAHDWHACEVVSD
jgi:hypothetical protein